MEPKLLTTSRKRSLEKHLETRGRKRKLKRTTNDLYYCEECDNKPFNSYFARYIHIARHHKAPAIKCYMPNCTDKFTTHANRDRHFINEHAIELIKKDASR